MAKSIEVIVSAKRADNVQRKLGKFAGEPPVVTTEEAYPGVTYLLYKVMPRRWGDFMQVLGNIRVDDYRIITE